MDEDLDNEEYIEYIKEMEEDYDPSLHKEVLKELQEWKHVAETEAGFCETPDELATYLHRCIHEDDECYSKYVDPIILKEELLEAGEELLKTKEENEKLKEEIKELKAKN